MDKEQALQKFWESFDIPAYDETSVSDRSSFPYITYSVSTSSLDMPVTISASLWYRSTSWEAISKKKNEIAESIGVGGKTIKIDDGYIWIKRGTPFAQRMADPSDDMVRRIYLSLDVEFLTAT